MSCGVCHRHSLDPALLWLRCGLAATAPMEPLAWEAPYATGAALEKARRQTNKNNKKDLFLTQGLQDPTFLATP